MEIKKHKINGKRVYIIDGVMDTYSIVATNRAAKDSKFSFSHYSDDLSSKPNLRQVHHINQEEIGEFKYLFKAEKKILKKFKKFKSMFIASVYVNVADAMTITLPHCDRPSGSWTLLYYANQDWNKDWCGATNFFDKNGEIALACLPKPGRFVLFEADILHQATPPTFYSPYKRFTIAFKLDPIEFAPDYNDPNDLNDPEEIIEEEVNVKSNTCW